LFTESFHFEKSFYKDNILKFYAFLSFIFFARPKKTNQKKGRPASRLILRFSKFSLLHKENKAPLRARITND